MLLPWQLSLSLSLPLPLPLPLSLLLSRQNNSYTILYLHIILRAYHVILNGLGNMNSFTCTYIDPWVLLKSSSLQLINTITLAIEIRVFLNYTIASHSYRYSLLFNLILLEYIVFFLFFFTVSFPCLVSYIHEMIPLVFCLCFFLLKISLI